jgi:Protein of unknown function (DUF2568)
VTRSQRSLLLLRVVMELGIVASFAYWGYELGHSTAGSIVLCLAVPTIAFGIWGGVDFRRAGPLAEPMRLVEELVISAAAAAALWSAGAPRLAVVLAALSVVYHGAVYAAGERLLNARV